MNDVYYLGQQFALILKGKAKIKQYGCSVSLKRNFYVSVQGRPSYSVVPVGLSFESLDTQGRSINLGEIAILEEEIRPFSKSVTEQGLTISALHNHWIFTKPTLMYIHVQSIEPPLNFARKVARAFMTLKSHPVEAD